MTPTRPRISPIQLPSTPPPRFADAFSTPPCSYAYSDSYSSGSSSQFYSPSSPILVTPRCEREIIMGGLVSRSPSYCESDDPESMAMDEKRSGSIEVPGIVLTEPLPDLPPRSPSPPLKSIMLLPPSSLPIPGESSISQHRPFSPAFMKLLNGRPNGSRTAATVKTALLFGVVLLGAWHLYASLDVPTLVDDVATSF